MVQLAHLTVRVNDHNDGEPLWPKDVQHLQHRLEVIGLVGVCLEGRKRAVTLWGDVRCGVVAPPYRVNAVPAWFKLQVMDRPPFLLVKQNIQLCIFSNFLRNVVCALKLVVEPVFGLIVVQPVHGHAQLRIGLIDGVTLFAYDVIVAEEKVMVAVDGTENVRFPRGEVCLQVVKLLRKRGVRPFLFPRERIVFVHKRHPLHFTPHAANQLHYDGNRVQQRRGTARDEDNLVAQHKQGTLRQHVTIDLTILLPGNNLRV
ncbi:S-adenosylmethionine decarboxylase [Angomonas deanei]|uniref:Uncharacterized protein n=1 Tax=Angomonas deanei TaxID=59799 RepID=A0A7G2CG06_9TRYP|nr:S-adenosylmethionine decarboxylase [Angomonas deanei]CAD2217947.1 hypothetical protein, conserved [Angomonas deanei]|eukprot:EPY37946.1 S-adenosylmethionine decarboxylase [Angomonas deanei]